jgi:hypothetical protein
MRRRFAGGATMQDTATGTKGKNEAGKDFVEHILLAPHVRFSGTLQPTPEEIAAHHQAHDDCFIANSVKTKIEVAPTPSVTLSLSKGSHNHDDCGCPSTTLGMTGARDGVAAERDQLRLCRWSEHEAFAAIGLIDDTLFGTVLQPLGGH